MARTSTPRPTQMVILGSLALLVGIAGTATAVTKIGPRNLKKGAVITGKLRDDAVTGAKLAEGAVTTEHLEDEAVTRPRLAPDAVTGSRVQDGSLGLEDVAQVVTEVTFDHPTLTGGACTQPDVGVRGMQGGDDILVFPQGYLDGWPVDVILEGYGPVGEFSIKVRVCNRGSSPVSADSLTVRVLLFR